ncbi:DUF1614 domain-containing protein [Thermosediminibacter oceani]|uniref:DUF1614 domain-containing protein n=1 Tax=Thermosediminibacter oceani (strain ATCC BAA-1034 / DSM 16646 / JW/IW-1228P) TaxID=555079 RepID=D9S2V6_THEOJ|nr:DUF1614 domain-containing protein [Thermosediminibacter oceani]ADL07733.1 protein of unknown function DUF1614 [Thermosediminibacter oceani DSM 16646]
MPVGVTLLLVLAVLIYFGLLQRVVDRMHMSDKTALIFIGAMIVGTFLPNIPLGRGLSINIGGGLVPIALVVYLIVTADSAEEKVRSISAAALAGLAVYAGGRLLPAEPETTYLDPLIVFSLLAGVIAYIFGRSRRGAFIAGVMGILISDIIYAFGAAGRPIGTTIGGAGVFDAAVIAGVIGVALCEFVGETREKLQGGTAKAEKKREEGEKNEDR